MPMRTTAIILAVVMVNATIARVAGGPGST